MLAAAKNANHEVIRTLVKAGANVGGKNSCGADALAYAASCGDNPEIVTAHLELGADAKAKDSDGKSAADYAQENGHLKDTDAYKALIGASL